jgi:HPt (histidine-containing phosphotransfer) domain-containing protein
LPDGGRPEVVPLTTNPASGAQDGQASLPSGVLDPVALDKLRQLDPTGRSGIVQRVLKTYDGSLQKLMAQFDAARAAADLDGLRHVAHTLRSSSASIGALGLSARCGEVETMIREGRASDLAPVLDALATESTQVAASVRAMLADQGPAA